MPGMSAADQASVIVAAAGLNMIQLLRSAMRTADMTVAGQNHAAGVPHPPQGHAVIGDHYRESEEHRISHPRRPIARGEVVYRRERVAPATSQSRRAVVNSCPTGSQPVHQPITLQQPWQVLPWPKHASAACHFKPAAAQPDIFDKGMFIDMFV